MSTVIADLPKVDLTRDFASSLERSELDKMAGDAAAGIDKIRKFTDLASLREALTYVRGLYTSPDHFQHAAQTIMEMLVIKSVVHAEFHIDPLASPVAIGEQLEAIELGHEIMTDEDPDALISFGYILEVPRNADIGAYREAVEAAVEASKRVVGIAFVGPEKKLKKKQVELAEWVKERAIALVISAGLEAGSKAMPDALELNASRVMHGLGILKRTEALTTLRARRTPFVVTPTVEVKAGRVRSYKRHPIADMHDRGLSVTFASGAPGLWGGDLTGEYEALSVALGWRLDRLRNNTLRAIEAGFIEPRLRFTLARAVENWRHRPRLVQGATDDGYSV